MLSLNPYQFIKQEGGGRRRARKSKRRTHRRQRSPRRRKRSSRKRRKRRTSRLGGVKVHPSLLRLPYAQPMSPPRRPLGPLSPLVVAQQLTGELPRRESYTLGNRGPVQVARWDASKPRRRTQARLAIGRFKAREATRRRRKAAESKWKSISKEGKSKHLEVYSDNIFKGHKTAMAKANKAEKEVIEDRTSLWGRTGR